MKTSVCFSFGNNVPVNEEEQLVDCKGVVDDYFEMARGDGYAFDFF